MLKPVSLFTLTAAIIVAAWWWLGKSVPLPPSPLVSGEKLYCISYAPFRGAQSPLDLSTKIEPAQIEQDLAQLAKVTECVRTYSVDFGLDQVPEIAQRHGLKVLLGLWVSSYTDRTQYQIRTGVALANKFPDVIRAVIVGNEALLRGEVSPAMLAETIRSVKSRVKMPVTYADVWEFWLRYRELASVVDFITIHILPYWEDEPVAARAAADHVDAIRQRVVANFPGQEIVIGEVGWPSAGRMREGALPSPANQARVISDILTRGKQEHFRVNVIEAFDQPWKRALEGTVGGHWGLFDDAMRRQKFTWGGAVSNHPHWPWQAAGGVVMAALMFGVALFARRNAASGEMAQSAWRAIVVSAAVAGVLAGWTIENLPVESLGIGGWLRNLSLAALAIAAPIVAAAAMSLSIGPPAFAKIIGPRPDRVRDPLVLALGALLMLLTVLAVQSSLSLSFNPRYRDFPFAPLTAAALPLLLASVLVPRPAGTVRALAETAGAVVLALSAIFIVWNETFANWQAIWFASALALIAISLLRARVAQD